MAEKTKPDEQSSAGAQLATFGGVGAAVALAHKGIDGPLKAIRRAEEMRKSGAGRKEIHSETSKMLEGTPYAGVTYGADKNPRFEIDDSGARLNRAALPSGGKAFAKDVLEHPALYDAYPTAQHITIEKNDKPGSQIKGNSIKLSPRRFAKTPLMGREILTPEAKPLLLHEVQHHIQDREGHAPGGDPSDFDKHPKWGNDPAKKELAYRMLAGEQEANMTIARRNMTAAQRRANMPVPEVPEAHQIVLEQSKGVRSRLDVASLSDAVRSAFDAIRNKDAAEGKAIRYRKVDPSNVNVDADTFQFKSGGDAAGVTDRLRGVKSWDPVAAGKSIMWERADGKLFVGDGHQRTGLAKRLQSEGQTGIRMDAAILRERDGWSAKDVRVFAAMKNIKEGSGTSLDMAKVMRERPDLVNHSLPLSDAKVRDAVSLSKLSPDAFGMVINGVVKPEHAAAVAAVGDSSRHASMLGEMSKAEIASSQHARLYVQQAMAAPQYTETTGSLFGEETQTRSLLSERAKVLDKAVQALKSDKKIFGLLEREAGQIEAAGNKLAHDVNAARAEGAGRTAELVERLAQNRGPVSEMLDRAARAVAEGEGPAKAARSFVREVHDTLKAGGMSGLMGDAPKAAPAPIDPNQANMFGGAGERPGWSDEAREKSAQVRAAKGAKKERNRVKAMVDEPARKETFQEMVARTREIHDRAERIIREEIAKSNPKLVVNQDKYGLKHVLTKQVGSDGYRITTFDADGMPLGHMEYANNERGISEMRRDMVSNGLGKDRVKSMMGSELPPRLGKGRTSAAAAKKWEAEFRDIPQDAAEKRLLARKQGERIGSESKRTKSMTDDMFGGPSTKDKIDAQSRKMAAKGRTGDPMNEGLFGSSKDQTDLVEQSKQQSPLRRLAAKELVDGVRNKKAAGSAPDEVPVAKNGRQLQGNNKATLAADAEANFSRAKTLRAQERKGKKAADMTKIKDELREMFARSPDGKQRNTKGELLPVRRGAEDVALKGGELTAVVNGKRVPVQSWEQLSSALRNTVDATGVGASQTPPVRVVDTSGKVIANVSYNGKIWAGDVGTWKSGDKPIYDPSATAQQGLRSGDMEMLKRTIKSGVGEGLSARHAAMLETATNAQLSELDTFAHEARKGSARTDVDFNRIGAFRQKIRDLARTQSDAAAKAQIEGKGPAGWSDAAREASAKARSVAAPGKAKEPKPRLKDAAVKDLVKKGLVTKEDVKTSASMSDLKAKARSSATQKLIDRGAEPTAAKSAGVADPHAQMHEMFAPKKDVPHQMTPAGQESRFISRMRAAGSNKTDAELKADFAKAPRKGIAKRTLSLLAPVAIGTAMLAASNEAKAAGMDSKGQSAEAAKAGAVSGAVMVGTTAAQGLAVRSLVRGGLSIARSVPLVQGVMMAGGAVVEGVKAYRDGGSAKDIALAAGKGAWDMSLPGMVVNTARDAKAAIDDRKALEQTPRVAGMQRFNEVAAQYKKRVSESRIVAPVEPSDGDNRPRGWANAKVQAAAQEAKGRNFSGVFKDGSHAQMQQ